MTLTDQQRRVLEKTTPNYTATLVDDSTPTPLPIPLLQISTIVLTFYDRRTNTIINSRTAQDVKNANNCTVHATTGLLTWSMQVADTTLVTTADFAEDETEEHCALFEWVLTNGKRGKFLTRFYIVQLVKVT